MMLHMTSPELLTTAEVAALCRVSPEAIRRWVRTGVLKAIPLPQGTLRYRREDIDELLKARLTTPATSP